MQLFEMADEPRPLTDRQQWIFNLIADTGQDGITADELGAHMHARKHDPGDRCDWCARDGLRALRERAIADRVVKRGSSYIAAGVDAPADTGSSQISELPGDSFEDIFGSAA